MVRLHDSIRDLSWFRAGLLATAVLAACSGRPSTTSPANEGPNAIALDGARLLRLLHDLSADALGGRYTLHSDIDVAADLIASYYRKAGVDPAASDGFVVNYDVRVGIDPGPATALTLEGKGAPPPTPATALMPMAEGGVGRAEGPLVFVGYGIVHDGSDDNFDELRSMPLDGAIAVLLAGTPPPTTAEDVDRPTFGRRDANLSRKLERLSAAGAAGVIVVDPLATSFPDPSVNRALRRQATIPVVQWTATAAESALPVLTSLRKELDRTAVPNSQPIPELRATLVADFHPRVIAAPNLLAMIPGTDLADEIVLLGAHFDHIGTDEAGHGHCQSITTEATTDAICNGADDNASGSAIVAELAIALTHSGLRPRRTLVFAHFSGEELGLLGSRALAATLDTQEPFAGRRVVAMLNIDMVGRLRERLTVSGVDSSAGWMPLLDDIGPRGMRTMYDRSLTTRSDHAPFYEQDIPALFFFTEVHDDYHAPGDSMDRILPKGVVSVAGLVEEITKRLADGAPIEFAPPTEPQFGLVPALPGDNPAAVLKEVGPAAG